MPPERTSLAFLTVKVDGAALRGLRLQRHWSQRELAKKVGCVKRTIENAEAGRRVQWETLEEIAEALGVAPEALAAGAPEESAAEADPQQGDESAEGTAAPTAAPPEPPTGSIPTADTGAGDASVSRVEVVLDCDFESFSDDDERAFLDLVKAIVPLVGAVRVVGRRPGSVVLTLDLTPEDAQRLMAAVREGRLADHRVKAVHAIAPPARECVGAPVPCSSDPLQHGAVPDGAAFNSPAAAAAREVRAWLQVCAAALLVWSCSVVWYCSLSSSRVFNNVALNTAVGRDTKPPPKHPTDDPSAHPSVTAPSPKREPGSGLSSPDGWAGLLLPWALAGVAACVICWAVGQVRRQKRAQGRPAP